MHKLMILFGRSGDSLEVETQWSNEFVKALQRALASPEGQIAGKALMSFAAEHVTLCFAEHMEEARGED